MEASFNDNVYISGGLFTTSLGINKSVEAQAVGRVHRIGQTKETFIHRFIVEDTIEERIDTLQKRKMVSNQRRANNTKSGARNHRYS